MSGPGDIKFREACLRAFPGWLKRVSGGNLLEMRPTETDGMEFRCPSSVKQLWFKFEWFSKEDGRCVLDTVLCETTRHDVSGKDPPETRDFSSLPLKGSRFRHVRCGKFIRMERDEWEFVRTIVLGEMKVRLTFTGGEGDTLRQYAMVGPEDFRGFPSMESFLLSEELKTGKTYMTD